ncbi:hypothetical protein GGF40_003219 [Coemansia sp. RSA 1286]|nr:hypothetical protein GGF40_003219 [Coemansia sp. RSA 1286]
MPCTVAASTSDTIRVWSLEVLGATPNTAATHKPYSRRTSSALLHRDPIQQSSETNTPATVTTTAVATADTISDAIGSVSCVSWDASGSTFIACGQGSSNMRQYDSHGTFIQDLGGTGALANIVAARQMGHDSTTLFVADNGQRQVRRWDLARRQYMGVCQTHENDISCMAVSARRKQVVTATVSGGEIAVFNVGYNTRSDLRSATHRALTCVDIARGHQALVAVGSDDGLVQLFDSARLDSSPTKTFSHVHAAPIRGICFGMDDTAVISAGLDSRIVVTDTRAYAPRSVRGKSSAVEIVADAPLTCLAGVADQYVVAAGTLDGELLVFDIRGHQNPVWRDTVGGGRHAVTSVSIARQTVGVRREEPSRRSYSDDDGVAALLAECRSRRDRLVDGGSRENHPPAKPDVFRPPQHPAATRQRVNEDPLVVDENASIMRSDRSFMDMLSPEKPAAKLSYQSSKKALELDRANGLARVSQMFAQAAPTSGVRSSRYGRAESSGRMAGYGRTPYDREVPRLVAREPPKMFEPTRSPEMQPPNPPLSLLKSPEMPRRSRLPPKSPEMPPPKLAASPKSPEPLRSLEPSAMPAPVHAVKPRDVGDSMMEMLSPERPPRSAVGVQLLPEIASSNSSKRVSQLLARHRKSLKPSVDRTPLAAGKRASAASASADSSATESVEEVFQTLPAREMPPPADPPRKIPVAKYSPFGTKAKTPVAANPPAVTPNKHRPAAVSEPAPALTSSVSSNVLHNLVADALAPLREQISGEIRNLHLDMMRQNFVYQEQLDALRRECSEARALRREMESLRRENEQLRRYVPFYNFIDSEKAANEEANDAATPATR